MEVLKKTFWSGVSRLWNCNNRILSIKNRVVHYYPPPKSLSYTQVDGTYMSRIEGRRASQSLSRKSLLQLPLSKSNFARDLESNKRESFIIKRHLPQKRGKMGRWRLSKHFSIRSIFPDFLSMKCFKTSISLRKSFLDQLASLVEAFFLWKTSEHHSSPKLISSCCGKSWGISFWGAKTVLHPF